MVLRNVRRWIFALLLLSPAAVVPLHAQTPAEIVVSDALREIRLADGSTLYGRIVAVEGERVTIQTEAGATLQVERAQIRSAAPVRGQVRGGEVWLDDPHGTRLFFAPTGRSLAQGEGYFGVYELFFPFLTYGVTDAITVAAGTPIIPGVIGEFAYLGPKVRVVNTPGVQASLGAFAGIFEGGTAGIAYGVGTWGNPDRALTAGAGYAFYTDGDGGDFADRPLLMAGGELRTGPRTKLLTENYFLLGESGGLISGGIRFFGERLSADAGIGLFVGADDVECCLPLVNFVYSFGGGR
jgi:hypothetical protein